MHVTIRHYEGVDPSRLDEVAEKVKASLIPQLRELPGFAGYYLIEADNGILNSLTLFETAPEADEAAPLVAQWITDEDLSAAVPNAPEITTGRVIAHSDGDADAYDTRGARVLSAD